MPKSIDHFNNVVLFGWLHSTKAKSKEKEKKKFSLSFGDYERTAVGRKVNFNNSLRVFKKEYSFINKFSTMRRRMLYTFLTFKLENADQHLLMQNLFIIYSL